MNTRGDDNIKMYNEIGNDANDDKVCDAVL